MKIVMYCSVLPIVGVLAVRAGDLPLPVPDRSTGENCMAYDDNLRDRCWMFGHDSSVYDSPGNVFNIPTSAPITMADACVDMGVSNVCVVRWNLPDDKYLEQFKNLKRVTWVVDNGDIHNHTEAKTDILPLFLDEGLKRLEKMPNLAGFEFDDFFYWKHEPLHDECLADGTPVKTLPASHSLSEVREAIGRMRAAGRRLNRRIDARLVVYSRDLVQGEAIRPMVNLVDTVLFWTWQAKGLAELRPNFERYRELFPDKPTFLGIYMWDFGGEKPIEPETMKMQLDFALEQFRLGRIDGVIFHCTMLVNKNLPQVDLCREWIRAHGHEKKGGARP